MTKEKGVLMADRLGREVAGQARDSRKGGDGCVAYRDGGCLWDGRAVDAELQAHGKSCHVAHHGDDYREGGLSVSDRHYAR